MSKEEGDRGAPSQRLIQGRGNHAGCKRCHTSLNRSISPRRRGSQEIKRCTSEKPSTRRFQRRLPSLTFATCTERSGFKNRFVESKATLRIIRHIARTEF
ncbi:unnamed protein product [Ectocarpus sp. 4 AP-2014]